MEEASARKRLLKDPANARRAIGMSQTEVASLMKTSTSAVARLEKGEANPTLATIQRFASALGSGGGRESNPPNRDRRLHWF